MSKNMLEEVYSLTLLSPSRGKELETTVIMSF